MLYTCEVCGKITEDRTRFCTRHKPKPLPRRPQWSKHRDSVRQARFRKAVLARDGNRCRHCGSKEDLRACHYPIPLRAFDPDDADAYNPKYGITLCKLCDRRTDQYAR
jgi:hypothetical protein